MSWANWLAVVTVALTLVDAATTSASTSNNGSVPPAVYVPLAGGLVHVIHHSTISQVIHALEREKDKLVLVCLVSQGICSMGAYSFLRCCKKMFHVAIWLGISGVSYTSTYFST
jgi:hypothetical protein